MFAHKTVHLFKPLSTFFVNQTGEDLSESPEISTKITETAQIGDLRVGIAALQ
jgi:hypothetical protein